ncbi:aspartate/glutamate racemase family protein [Conexibacter woesei]|uniref:Asp/Glu/hydantoin racemase n=1 Tax=Conexibacter woesei (strain DSM 14684 / CCUG 47730 / CIP 108061 / JCM 11494 / NBRC 100937 / ID131577) TaxID=469383 RepID=D3F597_CONWI|nr:aspartate/glutamate racemase family protein [Conexibacter woesei]ADB50564.1 Asp/Glu/hydantoin racemase [Conexibacter woesei DSM 14684]
MTQGDTIRIQILTPVVKGVLDDDVIPRLPSFVQAEAGWLTEGPSSIESRTDEARAVPAMLDAVVAAAADGVDGVVLNCFMDPAVGAARELTHLPVAAPGQSAMTLASTLGGRFSVILPAASGAPIVAEQAHAYVGRERLASVRSVEMAVAEMRDRDRLVTGLVEQAERAIGEDGADVVILGCTGMCGVTSAFRAALAHHDVPVIDPTVAAVGAVVSQLMLGVHHSGSAYALPAWRREAR